MEGNHNEIALVHKRVGECKLLGMKGYWAEILKERALIKGCVERIRCIRLWQKRFEQVDIYCTVLVGSGSMPIGRLLCLMVAPQLLLDGLRKMEHFEWFKC